MGSQAVPSGQNVALIRGKERLPFSRFLSPLPPVRSPPETSSQRRGGEGRQQHLRSAVLLLLLLAFQRVSTHLEGTGFPSETVPFKSIKNYFHELRLFACKPIIQTMQTFADAHGG